VSVEIADGEQVAIVGPSGSGKTTMLTIMGTLERPSARPEHEAIVGCRDGRSMLLGQSRSALPLKARSASDLAAARCRMPYAAVVIAANLSV
jgi:ABC-type nitrate/sulfonate/bicarbonate transport system ATPase subunit